MAGHGYGERPKSADSEQRLRDTQIERLNVMDRRLGRMAVWAFETDGARDAYYDLVMAQDCIRAAAKSLTKLKADVEEG